MDKNKPTDIKYGEQKDESNLLFLIKIVGSVVAVIAVLDFLF